MHLTHGRNARERASLTLIAGGLTALILGGCGSSNGGAGTGGAAPGTGGSAVGTGGSTAGTGGSAPGTGGASPGTGGSASGTGGIAIGTGGSASGTGGAAPANGGNTAAAGGAPASGGGNGGNGGNRGNGGNAGNGGHAGMTSATGGAGGRSPVTLTSPSLTNGAAFMPANTCAGANQSPALTWTAGPAATQSYAIVLVDTSITRYHWAIWNIPATSMTLAAALPAGASITAPVTALQAITGAATPAYQGPCPSGNVHTYVFTVYALDVATLPGIATGAMAQAVFTAIQTHVLASGTLSGTSDAVRP